MSANGYFEEFVNRQAPGLTPSDRALMAVLSKVVQEIIRGGAVHWAGSHRKGTAIASSDRDVCVASLEPVTLVQRRDLRIAIGERLGRQARILSHVVRVDTTPSEPKVDIAFANAAFGSRPLPDPVPFSTFPARIFATRALKLWTRAGGLPHVPGWALEALVIALDRPAGKYDGLALFLRIVDWIAKAKPADLEAILRPAVHPRWDPEWSPRVVGRLEALANASRALARRAPQPASWKGADDVRRWLTGQ